LMLVRDGFTDFDEVIRVTLTDEGKGDPIDIQHYFTLDGKGIDLFPDGRVATPEEVQAMKDSFAKEAKGGGGGGHGGHGGGHMHPPPYYYPPPYGYPPPHPDQAMHPHPHYPQQPGAAAAPAPAPTSGPPAVVGEAK